MAPTPKLVSLSHKTKKTKKANHTKKKKKAKKNTKSHMTKTPTNKATAKADMYRALLALPVPSGWLRPDVCDKFAYHGGRCYYSAKKSAYRVYKRSVDRVETTVAVKDAADKIVKFQVACAIIEQDPRPV